MDESREDEKGSPGETAVIWGCGGGGVQLPSVFSVNILSAACFFIVFLFLSFF